MKPWIYKHLLLLVILIGFVSTTTYADEREEFTRTIKKEFDIRKDGEIGISNQFGKIEINTWDKNRAKFSIIITVKCDTEKEAQEIFNRIDIDFSNGSDYVKAVTEISSEKNNWRNRGHNNIDFAINYEVFLPKTVNLEIENRHGDTYIPEMAGNADLDIAHGDLTADGFTGELDLELAHGNGTIISANNLEGNISHSNVRFKKLGNVQLEIAHSHIDLGDARKIKLESRHSKFEIGEIDELRLDSRHDQFQIETANAVFAESAHTTYTIDKLIKSADFDCTHGGATIDFLEKGFDEIILAGSHAGFRIRIDEAAAFTLDASGAHAGIRYPTDLDITYEKDKNNSQEVKGSRTGSGNKGLIRAKLSHGSLKIR